MVVRAAEPVNRRKPVCRDYPHRDAKTPDSVKLLATRTDLGDAAKRKIPGENAARVYRLTHQPAGKP